MDFEKALQIRTKKLGILIRDARQVSGRTNHACAEALGISPDGYDAYESGQQAPSLPELEALAYYLDVPLAHFWGTTALSELPPEESVTEKINRSLSLRQQSIGEKLQAARTAAGLSLEDLSRRSGITASLLERYESGETPVPVTELEAIVENLDGSLQAFIGGQGPVGDWLRERAAVQQLLSLPVELQDFVCKPINRPYIEIALRLSEMEVKKLRAVAEGLLDITL